MKKFRAVQYGCGPIGCSVVRFAVQRADIELVGAIDIDKQLEGHDLGEISNLGKKLGIVIDNDCITAVGNIIIYGFIVVKLFMRLVEISNFKISAMAHTPLLSRQFLQQNPQQCSFS